MIHLLCNYHDMRASAQREKVKLTALLAIVEAIFIIGAIVALAKVGAFENMADGYRAIFWSAGLLVLAIDIIVAVHRCCKPSLESRMKSSAAGIAAASASLEEARETQLQLTGVKIVDKVPVGSFINLEALRQDGMTATILEFPIVTTPPAKMEKNQCYFMFKNGRPSTRLVDVVHVVMHPSDGTRITNNEWLDGATSTEVVNRVQTLTPLLLGKIQNIGTHQA